MVVETCIVIKFHFECANVVFTLSHPHMISLYEICLLVYRRTSYLLNGQAQKPNTKQKVGGDVCVCVQLNLKIGHNLGLNMNNIRFLNRKSHNIFMDFPCSWRTY